MIVLEAVVALDQPMELPGRIGRAWVSVVRKEERVEREVVEAVRGRNIARCGGIAMAWAL